MRIIVLAVLAFLPELCFGQKQVTTKRDVLKAFKESTAADASLSDGWFTCNEDSAFYKAKLIKLYNHINYLYDPQHCCNHVGWKFLDSKRFALERTLICQEPPLGVTVRNNVYNVRLSDKQHQLMLSINNGIQTTTFKVVSLETVELWNKRDQSLVLTLERIN